MCHSEFEELEAVPTSSAIDGPLEPAPSTAISGTPDESFANYFSVCSLNSLVLFQFLLTHCSPDSTCLQ
jgi:hypothetical protein